MSDSTDTTDSSGNPIANAVGSAVGWLYYKFSGTQAAVDKGAQLDAQLAAVNAQNAANGVYTPEAYQQVLTDQQSAKFGDEQATMEQEAIAGANDGLDRVTALPGQVSNGIFDIFGKTLGGMLKSVPWWVWLLGIVAVFFYLGGAVILRSLIKKAAK